MTEPFCFAEPVFIDSPSECYFYHTMDLPRFGLQRGGWDLRGRFESYIGSVDVKGKRVIDIGCASGFLTFSAEEAGASEVVAFDMDGARRQDFLPFQHKQYYRDYEAWIEHHDKHIAQWKRAFWLAHRLAGSKAKAFFGDVYALPPALGLFDVAIVGAVMEHLADPIKALASIARLASSTIVINDDVMDTEEKIAGFRGNVGRPQDDYVFWRYSIGTYREVLRMLGFEIERVVKGEFYSERRGAFFPRTAIVAIRRDDPARSVSSGP